MAKTLGNAYYSAILNHDLAVAAGGICAIAVAERGILRRIASATGSAAPAPASNVTIRQFRTIGGTPTAVAVLTTTFAQGTTANTPLTFVPQVQIDVLEGDVFEFENGTAATTPIGNQTRTWTVEVAQSEGLGS